MLTVDAYSALLLETVAGTRGQAARAKGARAQGAIAPSGTFIEVALSLQLGYKKILLTF